MNPVCPTRIVSTPDTLGGRPRFEGSRLSVVDVLCMMFSDVDRRELLRDFPQLTPGHFDAALRYAVQVISDLPPAP